MKKLREVIIYSTLIVAACIIVPSAFAQGPGFDGDVDDVPVPVDGGVTLIAAAAAGYGFKKLRDRKKSK